ncbi:juvenile hormone esterase-like [Cylas formicarius]|uniref:juvenile hormone esterase-like n=1 Tax=Cylas formicarius TaxID=197179 RepID=UPI002958952F|nr:juvenile hormone esterase-like [Cylas formicarius]
MAVIKSVFVCVAIAFVVEAYDFKFPVAGTAYGSVRGVTRYSRGGRQYDSFTGIPYAKPPVGELRFAAPQDVEPWDPEFALDATKEPPICIQRNYVFSNNPPIEGQEDCLYLNVYAPKTGVYRRDDSGNGTLLPVLVFIHWGGFFAGRSTTGYLGPDYLMDKDVILVTFNYRLGPFGFLSTLDDAAPGNWGLKDQVLALKWIRNNIEAFGGDKDRVTISGQSAGSVSAHYHMLSPSSKGLFNQVVTDSATSLVIWGTPLNEVRLQVTIAQSLAVGCPNTTNTTAIVQCLRAVPAQTIMQSQDLLRTFYGDTVTVFSAVVERESINNPDPFITKTPTEYIETGEFRDVPWMVGLVQNEGILRAPSRIRPKEIRDALNANFAQILIDILGLGLSSPDNPRRLYQQLIDFYLSGQEYVNVSDPRSVQGFLNLYSDRLVVYGVYQTLMLQASKATKPIYLYNLDYRGRYTYGDYFAATDEDIDFEWGASHCDELLYLFSSDDLFPKLTGQDVVLSEKMVALWSNFVTYGDPNPPESPVLDRSIWTPLSVDVTPDDVRLLNITGNYETGPAFQPQRGYYPERMKLWSGCDIIENKGVATTR